MAEMRGAKVEKRFGYDAIVSPMSLALGWGLALATSVTLFLVPTLYTLASDVRGLRRRRAGPPSLRAVEGRSLRGLASSSSPRSAPEV